MQQQSFSVGTGHAIPDGQLFLTASIVENDGIPQSTETAVEKKERGGVQNATYLMLLLLLTQVAETSRNGGKHKNKPVTRFPIVNDVL